MKKFVALSIIAAASLSLTACSKSGGDAAANNSAVDANATENAAIEDINAATANVADAANAAVDNAAEAPADNAANAAE